MREVPTAEIHRSVLKNRVEFRDLRNSLLNKRLRPDYYPLQVATIAALTGPIDWMDERNKTSARRRDVVVEAWKKMGLEMMTPRATFYCWGRIPGGYASREFSSEFLEEGNVWMIPGSAYGEGGEGFVRISCAQSAERIAEAMERMEKFIS